MTHTADFVCLLMLRQYIHGIELSDHETAAATQLTLFTFRCYCFRKQPCLCFNNMSH